jgi:uncharacterized protein (DUF486 family)
MRPVRGFVFLPRLTVEKSVVDQSVVEAALRCRLARSLNRFWISVIKLIMTTILLLTVSNIFMTFAWYGHLKYRQAPLFQVILISWGIAFAEYCFQVPANRIGSYVFTPAQLKTIQEVITLTVFSVFSALYLGEKFRWNYLIGFALIVAAVFVIFKKW